MTHSVVFAHQGGWDELLLVLIPLALIWLVLRIVGSRLDKHAPDDSDET